MMFCNYSWSQEQEVRWVRVKSCCPSCRSRAIKAEGLFVTYLKYKGYLGTIEPDIESGTLYGKLAFIRDLVTYEAVDLKALEHEFRVGHDLHMAASVAASRENISLNDLARRALSEYIMNHAGQ
jgi:predicted HicB family RNase H-like nuclease